VYLYYPAVLVASTAWFARILDGDWKHEAVDPSANDWGERAYMSQNGSRGLYSR
jgi:hypothetical protein